MKKNILKTILLATGLSAIFSFASFAGEWKQDTTGWWWQNDDGSYPTSSWQWVDGNKDGIAECYYFDPNGYMAVNTEIEGSIVNADGAWTVNGVVQTQQTTQPTTAQTSNLKLETNFIKQEFVDCLGKDKNYVLNKLGSEFKESEIRNPFFDTVDGMIDDTRITLKFNSDTGTVFMITSYNGFGMFNHDKDGYYYSELNELLKTEAYMSKDNTICWRLSENPIIILESVPESLLSPEFNLYYLNE